ncbi:hypothetical protein ACFV2X_21640 [Streptomyces sp. NPDC059679]|uniref:hypothetical protein n=1 Tax=Streptomyces sp. NPDC059679 TaxID=3346903 RepID=UPI003687E29C
MWVLLGILGAVAVLGIFSSVLYTLVIPRSSFMVCRAFRLVADQLPGAEAQDRALAPVAAVAIVVTLIGWLISITLGLPARRWPRSRRRRRAARRACGSAAADSVVGHGWPTHPPSG